MIELNDLSEVLEYCNEVRKVYPELTLENNISKVELKQVKFTGCRLDGYLKDRFVVSRDIPYIPTLFIDGELFMSITPMEIESHQLHLKRASGNVLVGGLGMGYYISHLKDKGNVKSITVIEKDSNVIELYKKLMVEHPLAFASDKIELIEADVFEYQSDVLYDYAYFDIWASLDCSEALDDTNTIVANELVRSKKFAFWGMEKWLMGQLMRIQQETSEPSEVFDDLTDVLENECDFDLQWAKADMIDLIMKFGDIQ